MAKARGDHPVGAESVSAPSYHYRAFVNRVIDGDSIVCDVDLGFDLWKRNIHIRLNGIDTPELRSKDPAEREVARAVRDYVKDLIEGRDVLLDVHGTGKYGRWIATVYVEKLEWQSLNYNLVETGRAKRVSY